MRACRKIAIGLLGKMGLGSKLGDKVRISTIELDFMPWNRSAFLRIMGVWNNLGLCMGKKGFGAWRLALLYRFPL